MNYPTHCVNLWYYLVYKFNILFPVINRLTPEDKNILSNDWLRLGYMVVRYVLCFILFLWSRLSSNNCKKYEFAVPIA